MAFDNELDDFLKGQSGTAGQTFYLRDATSGMPLNSLDVRLGNARSPLATQGPFLDRFGRKILVDIFTSITTPLAALQFAGSSVPFLILTNPPASFGSTVEISLAESSVHILASQFTTIPGTNPGFAGFEILSGSLAINGRISFDSANRTLTISSIPSSSERPAVKAKLRLKDVASTSGDVQATVPDEIVIQFSPPLSPDTLGASIESVSPGSLKILGNTVSFLRVQGDPFYDPKLSVVKIPFQRDISSFNSTLSPSSMVQFVGNVSITRSDWIIPINFASPASLGSVKGSGGMSVTVSSGLRAHLPGILGTVWCNEMLFFVQGGDLVALGFESQSQGTNQPIKLFKGSTLTFQRPHDAQFIYSTQNGNETWTTSEIAKTTLGQPCTINGELTSSSGPTSMTLTKDDGSIRISLVIDTMLNVTPQSYALKNMLFKTKSITSMILSGVFSGDDLTEGVVNIKFALAQVVPFLPDPYATNIDFTPEKLLSTDLGSVLELLMTWKQDSDVKFDLSVAPDTLKLVDTIKGNLEGPDALYVESSRSDVGGLLPLNDRVPAPPTTEGVQQLVHRGPFFLDLSTNASQFGVQMNTASRPIGAMSPAISDLFLQLPCKQLSVVSLPCMQWEPVHIQSPSQELRFSDCGPTTVFNASTVALTPVSPRPALDGFLSAHSDTVSHPNLSIRFGLPFGMVAYSTWQRVLLFSEFPSVSVTQPKFSEQGLFGADQLSFKARYPLDISFPPRIHLTSPTIPGVAQQRVTGAVGGEDTSAMGNSSFVKTFNDTFGGNSGKIPVTRIDISGYGASIFSDWRSKEIVPGSASISKVQLQASVGRAIEEVVQISSVCYFFCFKVIKAFTTERSSDGRLYNVEGNWYATSDGEYDSGNPDIVSHPGVVQRARKVTNIRDIRDGQRVVSSPSAPPSERVVVQAVLFDCEIDLEGQPPTPALDQLGFVPIEGTFKPEDYARLISEVGALCRPLDTSINVAGSGLIMAIRSVGVGVTRANASSRPEFAIAAYGTIQFPKAGQWSMVLQSPDENVAANPINTSIGVPLIRATSPSDSPYRFADPDTLLSPDTANLNYSIVFSTGTQRVQFPRPIIKPGSNQMTSSLTPYIADLFALGVSSGPFPPRHVCIEFPTTAASLDIRPGAQIVLTLPPSDTFEPMSIRKIQNSVTNTTIIEIGSSSVPGSLTLQIDTTASIPWTLNINTISFASATTDQGIIMRVTGNLLSDASRPIPRFEKTMLDFGPNPSAVAKLIGFLQALGPLPDMQTALANEFKVTAQLHASKKNIEQVSKSIPAFKELIDFFKKLDVKTKYETSLSTGVVNAFLEAELHIPLGGFGFFVAVIAGAGFEMPKSGPLLWKAEAGLGFGYKQKIPGTGFHISAELAMIITAEFMANSFLAGGKIRFMAELDFGVAWGSALYEGGVRKHRQVCVHPEKRDVIWSITQNTVAVEVHIFWILDIEFEYHDERHDKDNNGHCEWDGT